jgi:hypothetical protein
MELSRKEHTVNHQAFRVKTAESFISSFRAASYCFIFRQSEVDEHSLELISSL